MSETPLDLDAIDRMVTAGHWVNGRDGSVARTVRRLCDELRASRAEVERLRALVRDAFNEGWGAGRGSVSPFHGEYRNERQEAWENTDAYDALNEQRAAQT